MKKLMMIALCGLLSVPAFAGDIYAIKMSSKVPAIKQATTYYKDFTTTTYNGYVDVVYDVDGKIVVPSEAILYGTFAEGKAIRNMSFDMSVLNVYGKNRDKAEVSVDCDLGTLTMTLVGVGTCKVVSYGENACGESATCEKTIRIDYISGNFTGLITDILCDPCEDASWTWKFNSCVSDLLDPGTVDVVYGNWSMRHNKPLSTKCAEVGFPECVMDRIPKAYKPTE